MRVNPVKKMLKEGKPVVGTWLTLGNITASRFLARMGFDYLTVDIEHNAMGMETATHMFGAIADSKCTALARVPAAKHDHIKRVLDNGAHGVVVPMVNTRQEAEESVAACLYPPKGTRSVGGSAHALNFDTTAAEYFQKANDEILIVLQCEHIMAVRNFEEVYGVPGVDAVFVGPNDLAASMRTPDGKPPAPDAFKEALKTILEGCKKLKIPAGIHTFSPEEAKMRIAEGWQFIAINSELRFMSEGAKNALDAITGKTTENVIKY
ncbi:HpcH/HpaI aldolase family protein [Zavarzinella formosa]|uniref:HpcH/HpaI aldolase family protein n=1 Tax=Zavarzinella formosa TaxID=360055 RepID=UPI0002DF6AAE|nr:aldolase/citrate lyase family protein [Zavarzinella formosa]